MSAATRVFHFGVQPTKADLHAPIVRSTVGSWLNDTMFVTDGDSFTEWGEAYVGGADALHVTITVDISSDCEPEELRVSREEARELYDLLAEELAGLNVRLADYWVETSDEWSEDARIHGLWALESISGRSLAGGAR